MKKAKKFFMIFLSIMLMIYVSSCGASNPETSRNVVYKERDEVEADVKTYLKEKYGKEFVVAVTDNPNHIYSSYAASAYAADDESMEMFDVTIAYADEENYGVIDNYFMYSISDDLVEWFTELADPYIDCDFKVFYYPFSNLPSDYSECKTAEDFLELSPTASYYGLIFEIFLPSTEIDKLPSTETDKPINEICDSIAQEMLNRKIRGQIGIQVYKDEEVYDQIKTKEDERHFWTHQYRNISCTSTISGDFSFSEAKIRKGGDWHLDDETYNKEILNDN